MKIMTWLIDTYVDRIYTKKNLLKYVVINHSVSSGRYWSKLANKVWNENYEHAINLNFSFELTDVNQSKFIIWDGHSNNET